MMEVPLTRGLVALVDDTDYDQVSRFSWCATRVGRRFYAVRTEQRGGRRRTVLMHRWLMTPPAHLEVDHRNGNGLDNRRENLRIATSSQNKANRKVRLESKTSRYHGVHWDKARGQWRVSVRGGEKGASGKSRSVHIGRFDDEVEAARAYDSAAIRYHGEFSATNFPKEDYQ